MEFGCGLGVAAGPLSLLIDAMPRWMKTVGLGFGMNAVVVLL